MRSLARLGALAALVGAASCTDYFDGTDLYFVLSGKLPIQDRIADADLTATPPVVCADESYLVLHPEQRGAYEYHVWATVNGGPARLAKFTTRDCSYAALDPFSKPATTSVTYYRNAFGYPDESKGSALYGVLSGLVNGFQIGGTHFATDVRLENATEVFITREPRGIPDTTPPNDYVVMRGDLRVEGSTLSATLNPVNGRADGTLVAIPVERSSAW
jgi:hypothetical protein